VCVCVCVCVCGRVCVLQLRRWHCTLTATKEGVLHRCCWPIAACALYWKLFSLLLQVVMLALFTGNTASPLFVFLHFNYVLLSFKCAYCASCTKLPPARNG